MTFGVFCHHHRCWSIMSVVFHYFWILPFCMGAFITVVQTGEDKVVTWNKSNSISLSNYERGPSKDHTFEVWSKSLQWLWWRRSLKKLLKGRRPTRDNDLSQKLTWSLRLRFGEGGASLTIAAESNLITKCPIGLDTAEFYKIYWVPQSAFENCFVTEDMMDDIKLLVYCNNKTDEFVTLISRFSGVPGSTDFELGKNYYLATFSEGTHNEVDNLWHGACHKYNMKLNLTVVEEEPATTQAPTNKTTQSTRTPTTSTKQTTTTASTTSSTRMTQSSTILTSTLLTTSSTSTDIPEPTDIVITVPGGGNTGIITVGSGSRTTNISVLLLVLSLSLSLFHVLNSRHIYGCVSR